MAQQTLPFHHKHKGLFFWPAKTRNKTVNLTTMCLDLTYYVHKGFIIKGFSVFLHAARKSRDNDVL